MKKYWKEIVGVIILALVLWMSLNTPSKVMSVEMKEQIDKTTQEFKQEKEEIESSIKIWKENYKERYKIINDSLIRGELFEKVVSEAEEINLKLMNQIDQKNNDFLDLKKDQLMSNSKRVNTWMLIFIVLISGLLGGYARTNSHLLKEAFETAKAIVEESKELERTGGMETSITEKRRKLDSEQFKLLETIAKMSEGNEDTEKTKVNIVFGVIASAMSFLALTTFSSKTLDFQSETDYFVFLGWCLIGAVFAKNWIKSIFNKITG